MKYHTLCRIICAIFILGIHSGVVLASKDQIGAEKRTVTVSVIPQKYFVERISQGQFEVKSIVASGASPVTYEPSSQQIHDIAQSEIFFAIGMPFEESLISKVLKSNPNLTVIKTDHGIEKLSIHAVTYQEDLRNSENLQRNHQKKKAHSQNHSSDVKQDSSTSFEKNASIYKIDRDGHITAKVETPPPHKTKEKKIGHSNHRKNDSEEKKNPSHEEKNHESNHSSQSKKTIKEQENISKHSEVKDHQSEKKSGKSSTVKKNKEEEVKDPYIWLSPPLAIIQARNILNALQEMDPTHYVFYENNYRLLVSEILQLDAELRDILKEKEQTAFIVSDPEWGYFADTYGLKQIPINTKRKKPNGNDIESLILYAKKENIRVIFSSPQSSPALSKQVADEIDGSLIVIDPNDPDWMKTLRNAAKSLTSTVR